MSVEKLADGTGYTVRWRDSSGRQRKKKVTLWRDAVNLDGDLKRKKVMGELIAHEKGTIRLCDFWDVWVGAYGSVSLTPRTLGTYTALYSKHISPSIGNARLRDLNRETISALISKLTESLSPASTRKVLAILQGVLQRAVEWGYIAANPAVGVAKPSLANQRRGRALTEDELRALLKELPRLRDRVIVCLLGGSGLRPGELRGLCWGDWRTTWLSVERAISGNVTKLPKNNRCRAVPLSDEAQTIMKEWYLACGRPSSIHFVFGTGIKAWTDQGWKMWQRKVFMPAAKRAGLEGLRPYDLRHTYASQRIAQGADILTLASQLGHSPTMTLTVYGHLLSQVSAPGVPLPTAQVTNP